MSLKEKNCCVVGCNNCEGRPKEGVKFFSFPGRQWEEVRKERWIRAVKRINSDGTMWSPSENTRICSEHFVGGVLSNIEGHPSYVPSIFPENYKKRTATQDDVEGVVKRTKERSLQSCKNEIIIDHPPTINSVSTFTQCDFELQDNDFLFSCTFEYKNVATSCNIPRQTFEQVDKACGPSIPFEICKGFHGYESIKDEKDLISLTSVSEEVFDFLLTFLPTNLSSSVGIKSALLLFLVKMKTGLYFTELAEFFGVHRSTASRLFYSILDILSFETAQFVVWPRRTSIQSTMPQVFKNYNPNIRAIIDCIEIKTDAPGRVDERVEMYSYYKKCHTFKFLIAVTPDGVVSFKSKCYGGKVSDFNIINDSEFLTMLEPGDVVLAHKGFSGLKSKTDDDFVIVLPPFDHNASVRSHVERCIQKINNFQILEYVKKELFPHIDNIVHIACVLSNFDKK